MLINLKNFQRRKSKDIGKRFKNIFNIFNCIGNIIRLLTLLSLCVIGFCIYYYFSQNILKGLVILNKNYLKFPTKLYTDNHGIIHIRAANFDDAFFTLGYSQARDRLWQIDFLRRFAKGKLSQIIGSKAIRIDKYMRNLGIGFRAKNDLKSFLGIRTENFFNGNFNYDNESYREIEIIKQVEKFVDGINYYAKNNYLPLEYYILNVKFEKFSLVDCFSISRLIGFLLTFDWHLEIFNHVMELSQGKEFIEKFDFWNFRNFPFANETIVNHEEIIKMNLNIENFDLEKITNFKNYKIDYLSNKTENNQIFEENIKYLDYLDKHEKLNLKEKEILITKAKDISYLLFSKENLNNNIKTKNTEKEDLNSLDVNMLISQASNSWVIHGNRTKSGKPLLTNDPHLTNKLPTLHYLAKLYIGKPQEDIENIIFGSTFPGIPVILFGNNKYISWGFTTDNRDTLDIIEEFVTPDYKYFIDSEGNISRTFSRKEKIRLKNEKNQYYKIYYTETGVIIDEYLKETSIFGVNYKHSLNDTYDKNWNEMEKLEELIIEDINKNNTLFNFTNYKRRINNMNEIVFKNQTFVKVLCLRFPSYEMELGALKFYFDLLKAKKKEDFLESLSEVTTPVLSFSWATTEGEIGYTSIGKIPIKNYKESKIIKKDSLLKSNDYEIQGMISREETPMLINPEKDFIVTANNEAYSWNYKNYVQSYAFFNRFHRINEIIINKFKDENFKFGVEDSIEILSDLHDSYAEILLPKLLKILKVNLIYLKEKIQDIHNCLIDFEKIINENLNDNNTNKVLDESNNFINDKPNLNIGNDELNHNTGNKNILNANLNRKIIERFGINMKSIENYEIKLKLIEEILNKLNKFDFKFHKESEEATIYSVLEYILAKNLLLRGERDLENLIYEYKQKHDYIDENFDPFVTGFEEENTANGILNIMNYWNFIVNLITEISEGKKIDLENCNYYKYLKEYKNDFMKSFFFNFRSNSSSCENYLATTLFYFIDYVIEKNYIDKNNIFIKWGQIHYNNYPHEPFENVEFLRILFSRNIPTGGNRNTIKVSKNKFNDPKNPFASSHSANLKYICDLNDITRPYVLIDTGNSGNILSEFYDNFLEKSENNDFVKVKDHNFNDDYHLLISFPEDNTLIFRNPY